MPKAKKKKTKDPLDEVIKWIHKENSKWTPRLPEPCCAEHSKHSHK